MLLSEPDNTLPTKQVLALVHEKGIVRPRDVAALGLSPTHLQRLYEQGRIQRYRVSTILGASDRVHRGD